MSGHEEDALFAHEMFMSRLDFEEAVRQALISTHLDARRACAASSAQARAAVEASVLLRRRCRDVRARAVALRKALASKRAMMAAGPRVAVPLSSLGALPEPAMPAAIFCRTASIFSANGRAASAAACARRSLDAATICMALVIFCVALVAAIRTRISLRLAISFRT